MKKYSLYLLTFVIISCSAEQEKNSGSAEITASEIKAHITFLASDSLRGREAGTPYEAEAANYIADYFRDFRLEPAGGNGTYFQEFTINTAILRNPHASNDADAEGEKRLAKNVVGFLPGLANSDEIIVIGAHYDHLGMGDFGSLYRGDTKRIHNGADDNASGTAGVLELAQYFSNNRPLTSILFIAFSGEEMGLLGSQHYVDNPTVDIESTLAMINMDMIGRMSNKKLMIFGTGTTETWPDILQTANTEELDLDLVSDGTGASDHTPFYYKDIPSLHYFTDTHSDYHRPSDDVDYINAEGEALALKHLVRVINYLDTIDKEQLPFKAAPGAQRQAVRLNGPTLGVLPDYGYDGEGFKISGVTDGRPAQKAGLQAGDVLISLGGQDLADIYGYMEALNTLKKGELTKVKILRDGKEMTLDIQL